MMCRLCELYRARRHRKENGIKKFIPNVVKYPELVDIAYRKIKAEEQDYEKA